MPIKVDKSNIVSRKELIVPFYSPEDERNGIKRALVVVSGIAVFDYKHSSPNPWSYETLRILVPCPEFRQLSDEHIQVIAALSSIWNDGTAVNAGWAIDSFRAFFDANEHRIWVECALAVSDHDGYIRRVAYQVTAVGQLLLR